MLSTSTLSFRGLAMALALVAGVAVVSDASAMSRKDKRTLVGAVVGGVAGNLLSNGDPAATVGGAVAGGAIGNLTTSDRRDRRYYDNRYYDNRYDRRYDRGYYRSGYYDRGDDRRWQRERYYDNRYTTTAAAIAAGKQRIGNAGADAGTGGSMTRPFALTTRMALNAQPWM